MKIVLGNLRLLGQVYKVGGKRFGSFRGWSAELEGCSGRRQDVNCYVETSFEKGKTSHKNLHRVFVIASLWSSKPGSNREVLQ